MTSSRFYSFMAGRYWWNMSLWLVVNTYKPGYMYCLTTNILFVCFLYICFVQHVIRRLGVGGDHVFSRIYTLTDCFTASASVPDQKLSASYRRSWSRVEIVLSEECGFQSEAMVLWARCEKLGNRPKIWNTVLEQNKKLIPVVCAVASSHFSLCNQCYKVRITYVSLHPTVGY